MARQRFALAYGNKEFSVSIPEEDLLGTLKGRYFPPLDDVPSAVRAALDNPIASPKLKEIVHPGEKVAILVSDITRAWVRSDLFLPTLLEELNQAGIPDQDIFIMIAVGSHRAQTREEQVRLVGQEVAERVRVFEHDCRDKENMVYLGQTPAGTPISINKMVAEANRIILTGGIVHHFLNGYGGGMKSIMPGVSSYESIMAHHKVSLSPVRGGGINDRTDSGKTTGNPFYEDVVAAGKLAKPDFLLNVVMNTTGQIGHVVAGDPVQAHLAGSRIVDEYYNVPITEKAELVVASCGGYPKDLNFYQSSKSLYNAIRATKEGKVLVLLSQCPEGLGNDLVAKVITDFDTNLERENYLRDNYDIAGWVGFLTTICAEKCDVILVTDMPSDLVRQVGMTPANSLEEAMEVAYRKTGPNPKTYVMPHAATAFPILE